MLCAVQVEASAMGRSIVQGSQTKVTLCTYIELLEDLRINKIMTPTNWMWPMSSLIIRSWR